MARIPSLVPSGRKHGAQRMFSATTLSIEALVVVFAALAAHQLLPDSRLLTWVWSLVLAVALLACAGMLSRGSAVPYLVGVVLQVPVILLGIIMIPMWVLGAGFAILYVYGLLQGHRMDREKDEIDARVLAERGEA